MQTTSTSWKTNFGCVDENNRPNFVPMTYIQIKYTVNDPTAQADAECTDNGHMEYSNVGQLTNGQDRDNIRFLSLEHNSWVLDGTWTTKPSTTTKDFGFVCSDLCDANGYWETNPIITIGFDSVYQTTLAGITTIWSTAYNEWASEYKVNWYNGTTLVGTTTVSNNTETTSVAGADITNYNKIEIEIVRWCKPYHRARVEDITLGVISVFNKENLMSLADNRESDMLSLTLPTSEIQFSLANADDWWNPDNPSNAYKYLIEQQKINVKYGLKLDDGIEWIDSGVFYMSEWNTPQNGITASFTASSVLDFMNKKYTVPSNTTMTLYALCNDAFTQANLHTNVDGSNVWHIDTSLQNISVTLPTNSDGTVKFDYKLAEVVQLCANAACCTIRIARDGNVYIEPLSTTLTDYLIDRFVSYSNAEYEISKPLASVNVNDGLGTYTVGSSGEIQDIQNDLIQSGSVANAVAKWVGDTLAGRKTLSGEYRADPRADALDLVTVKNKYATNTIVLTSLNYTYSGAFHANYEGRAITLDE